MPHGLDASRPQCLLHHLRMVPDGAAMVPGIGNADNWQCSAMRGSGDAS
jgi:hypothetical protein